MEFLMSGFLHEKIVPGPYSSILKYFRKCFRFCEDIHEMGSSKDHFFALIHNPCHVQKDQS